MRSPSATDLAIPVTLLLRIDINTRISAVLADLALGQIVLIEEQRHGVHAATEELLRALPDHEHTLKHYRSFLPVLTVTTPETRVDSLIAGMLGDPVQRWYIVERVGEPVGVVPPFVFALPARRLTNLAGQIAGAASILGLYGSPVTKPLSVCYRCDHTPTPHTLTSAAARLQPGYPHDVRCPEGFVMRRRNPCR